jgi:hypothetical protein
MKQQEMVKIPVHSLIDLVTNSSTEIFVHSEDSVAPAKELLTELLRLQGSTLTCDEVFEVTCQIDDDGLENYFGDLEYHDEDLNEQLGLSEISDWKKRNEKIKEIVKEIREGKREMPELDEYSVQTFLIVKSKDPKYDNLVNMLVKLLYSPDYFEYSNG